MFAPGHVLIAGALAAAGAAHLLLLREIRHAGRGLVGVTLLILAGVNVWLPAMVGQPDAAGAAPALFTISVVILVDGARHAAHDVRGHDLRAAPHEPAAGDRRRAICASW